MKTQEELLEEIVLLRTKTERLERSYANIQRDYNNQLYTIHRLRNEVSDGVKAWRDLLGENLKLQFDIELRDARDNGLDWQTPSLFLFIEETFRKVNTGGNDQSCIHDLASSLRKYDYYNDYEKAVGAASTFLQDVITAKYTIETRKFKEKNE
jgi:hypothetical protein